jgi:hypothetical protein
VTMMTNVTLTGRGDLDDQRWLDQQVVALGDGIEAARGIWANWSDLRNVGRLHPGQSAGEYIASLGLRLTLPEAMAALPDGSTREIARVAGVGTMTVHDARVRDRTPDEPPARVIGADGKSYPGRVVRAVTAEVIEPTDEPGHQPGHEPVVERPPERPWLGLSESTRSWVERSTRWYLNAVVRYVNRPGSRDLHDQYGAALDALAAAIRPSDVHQAELEVGRAQRALDRAIASRPKSARLDQRCDGETRASERLRQARERLANLTAAAS